MNYTPEQILMRQVHQAFVNTEKSVHTASKDAAICQATMQVNADQLGAHWGVGLKALAKVSEANSLMVRARQLMIEAHPIMKRVPKMLGLADEAHGDLGYGHMEPTPFMSSEGQLSHQPALQIAS